MDFDPAELQRLRAPSRALLQAGGESDKSTLSSQHPPNREGSMEHTATQCPNGAPPGAAAADPRRHGGGARAKVATARFHADTHPSSYWRYSTVGQGLCATRKTRTAGTLRVFVVPSDRRQAAVRELQITTKKSVLKLVSIPSGDAATQDNGGEIAAANIGELLASHAPAGMAVVVWRCFGGPPPTVDALRDEYTAAVADAVETYHASVLQEQLPSGSTADGTRLLPSAREPDATALDSPRVSTLDRFILPLPVPCVLYHADFLDRRSADAFLEKFAPLRGGSVVWATSPRVNHATAVYADAGITYCSGTTAGYASREVHAWTSELLRLRELVEAWYTETSGIPVAFNVCLLNRYADGRQSLGWHSDREEMDPALAAPRASPIASISLGTPRQFGLRRHGSETVDVVRLAHGSVCVMENACQFLYKHSLLPEQGADGVRVNLTFRAKRSVLPAEPAETVHLADAIANDSVQSSTFVGRRDDAVSDNGWNACLSHPFESPFINDDAKTAAARYTAWLRSQPVFHAWVVRSLAGQRLDASDSQHDQEHVRALSAAIAEARGGSHGHPHSSDVASPAVAPEVPPRGRVLIGNFGALAKRVDASTPLCRDHAKGECRRGERCKFSHASRGSSSFADVRVDRSTPLGNPFVMGRSGKDESQRDAACDAFACLVVGDAEGTSVAEIGRRFGVEVDSRFADSAKCATRRAEALEQLQKRLLRGESVRLLCWCAPKRCHAETIAQLLTS